MTDDEAGPAGRPPLFIGHEIYRLSRYGRKHPLAIPRVSTVIDLARALGWLPEAQYQASPLASREQLIRFHDPAYVDALMTAERDGTLPEPLRQRYAIGRANNPIFPEVFRRPATAAGGTLLAAELTRSGGVVHHPAGGTHHGRPDRASGFCYLNDPVLGLLRWRELGLEAIAYVDLDAHHGDGVEDAFAHDRHVFTLSVHEAGRWPHTGQVTDTAGGTALNLPLPPGLNDSEFAAALEGVVLPAVRRLAPQALMIQCGADSLLEDPQSRQGLSNRALWAAVAALVPLAPRVILLGGGGYNPWSVARCWTGLWGVLNQRAVPERLPPAAEAVLRGLHWEHRQGRFPPESWFTTLADPPRPGVCRPETLAVLDAARAHPLFD